METLVEAGEVVAYTSYLSNATHTEVHDVAGVERTGVKARYQRALRAYREGRSRYSPERRTAGETLGWASNYNAYRAPSKEHGGG